MFVGWDWASITHDVTVIDTAGALVNRWASPHTEQGLTQTITRLARHGEPADLPVAIERPSGLVVDRLLAAVAARSCPSMRPRSTPPGPAGAPPAPSPTPSPTPATATSSPTTCAPTATGSAACSRLQPPAAACSHWTTSPANSRRWYGCGRITSRPRPPPATSSTPCWTLTGPAPRRSFPGWRQRSPWPSWTPTPPPGDHPTRRGPPGRLLPPALLPRRPRPCRAPPAPACRTHPTGRARPRDPHRARQRPGPAATHPAGDDRRSRPCHRRGTPEPYQGQAPGAHALHRRDQPRPDRRRGRPHPGPGQQRRARHRRVRRRPSHPRLRQDPHRQLPLGSQPPRPHRPARLRRQLPPRLTVGGQALHRRPPTRQAPPPCHPDPGPRLASGHVGLLAHRYRLQPHQPPRRTTPRRRNLTQATQALPRPRSLRSPQPDAPGQPEQGCLTSIGASTPTAKASSAP
jgi:hypothetical protein